jgi:DNA-binding NtrC family response regulator
MPPLRERKGDIKMLVEHFLAKKRFTPASSPARITEEALAQLESYFWPGNVRELENTIERAVALARGELITTDHIQLGLTRDAFRLDLNPLLDRRLTLEAALGEVERQLIELALRRSEGNEEQAANLLGISVADLRRRQEQAKVLAST